MSTEENRRRILLQRAAMLRGLPLHLGASKDDLRKMLAEAAQNTAAQQQQLPDDR